MTGHLTGDARKRIQEAEAAIAPLLIKANPESAGLGFESLVAHDDLDEVELEELEDVLVEYDERGDMFGTSGAGAQFLAQFLVRAGYVRRARAFRTIEAICDEWAKNAGDGRDVESKTLREAVRILRVALIIEEADQ